MVLISSYLHSDHWFTSITFYSLLTYTGSCAMDAQCKQFGENKSAVAHPVRETFIYVAFVSALQKQGWRCNFRFEQPPEVWSQGSWTESASPPLRCFARSSVAASLWVLLPSVSSPVSEKHCPVLLTDWLFFFFFFFLFFFFCLNKALSLLLVALHARLHHDRQSNLDFLCLNVFCCPPGFLLFLSPPVQSFFLGLYQITDLATPRFLAISLIGVCSCFLFGIFLSV